MSDAEALAQDWQRVGDDLRRAMGMPTQAEAIKNLENIKRWGLSEALGPVLRRNFRGTEEQVMELAQRFANERVVDVDYWDESDKSSKPGVKAISLRTVSPLSALVAERKRQQEDERRAALRKTWK